MAAGRRLAAIVFTDIAGFTPLTQADEAGAMRLLQEQDALVRPLLEAHRGRLVKSMGDGLLLEFGNALDAVECMVELQGRVHRRNQEEPRRPLRLRIGVHLGDVQGVGEDIVGDTVNIASRVEPFAEPGGIALSAQVFDQVHNKVACRLERLGPKTLKGVQERVDLYRVVLPWGLEPLAAGTSTHPRVAVLPLVSISPDPSDEYFADGLTEELISVLSQARGLRVISRTSVNQYKGTTKPIAQIGSELGADSVLEGSVRKAGDQLRIAVQLIDPRTDEHRWTQTYDRRLENVFAIQAEVAEQTARALRVELLRSEQQAVEERPTSSLMAYEAYLRALDATRRLTSAPGRLEEIDREATMHYEAALREDPGFAAAYASYATHLILVMGMTRSGKDVFPRARELVAKSLELNPNLSEAHTARANLALQADHDWPLAEEEFRRAIAVNPSASSARVWYGQLLSVLQRFDEAVEVFRAGVELDPLWFAPRAGLVWSLYCAGDLDGAIALAVKTVESFRGQPTAQALLALLYLRAGRLEESRAALRPLLTLQDLNARIACAVFDALGGSPDRARALLAELEEQAKGGYAAVAPLAALHALVGEKEAALDLLERDLREGDQVFWAHYQDPSFDGIREDPRFTAMVQALHLPTGSSPSGRPRRPG